nr:methionyl-tRNA formyltransferase [Gammaproteobacteria bacterium]
MRLIFAGAPAYALPALRALVGSPHEIVAVFTQPDRQAGRGRTLRSSPVKRFAEQHGLPVYQPASLATRDAEQTIATLPAEVMV